MNPKVSIITPIYNESSNIKQCYAQVMGQTYNNIEWVVINDGSTDNSLDILSEIVQSHISDEICIKVIDQKNTGAALARKKAIEQSTGIYCSILDCDDYLSKDSIKLAVSEITYNNEIEIVCFNVDFITNGVVESKFNYAFSEWPISGLDAFKATIDYWGMSGWFFFKKDLMLKSVEQYQLKIGNNINDDEILSRFCFYNANLVSLCSGVYGYVNNPESTTKRINKNYFKIINTANYLNSFIKENCNEMKHQSMTNLISNIWSVFNRTLKWKGELDNLAEWNEILKVTSNKIKITDVISFHNKKASVENIIKIACIKIYCKFR